MLDKPQVYLGVKTPIFERDSIEFYNDKRRWNDEARKHFVMVMTWQQDTPTTFFYGMFGIYQACYILNQLEKDGFILELRIKGTKVIRANHDLFKKDLFSTMG